MNGTEKMSKDEIQNQINVCVKSQSAKESPFQRNSSDPKRRSRASIRQIPRKASITSIKSRGGWGNKWGQFSSFFKNFASFLK